MNRIPARSDAADGAQQRARLWHALQLGPLWHLRAATPDESDRTPVQSLDWEQLERSVRECTACALCNTRTQTVFGVGARTAPWMFIGEAPGAEEDARGEPFVGQAGRLLDNMLAAAGLGRERTGDAAVFIANVVKCRPPGNRNPEPAEIAACAPFLRRQIDLLQPRMIVVMGRFASQLLLATDASVGSLRGRVHRYAGAQRNYPVVVSYHPAYLLRSLADKAKAWDDLCLALAASEQAASDQPSPPP